MGSTSPRNVCGRRWRWQGRGLSSRSISTNSCGMWYGPTGKDKKYQGKKSREGSSPREARRRTRATPLLSKEFCDTLYLQVRFIQDLSPETCSLLHRLYKESQHHRVWQRSHCILLSFQG